MKIPSALLLMSLLGLSMGSGRLLAQASPQGAPAAPTPPAAAQAASQRNIRFQFDGIPYTDVIERFAQMANKPLLAETNVQGTLTYNDPNPYNLAEALDTLNLILSMKGVMLVESGANLRLIPFRQLPAMPLRILRGTDATGDVRPGEVATVVLEVKNLDSKEVGEAVTTMLSSAGSLAPLSRGRGLIITDRMANIQRIRTLLATIDTESTVNRQMKTYTLLHASGAIVADLLNRTFGVATAPKRTTYNPNSKAMEVLPPDPNDYITAVHDEASRTMVLFGPEERLQLAEELINKFEQKDGPGGDVRIYYPQVTKPEDLANLLRQAIPGIAAPNETAAAAATKARLIVDNTQNRLIVAAPIPGQLEQIETLINRVDKPVHGQMVGPNVPVRSQTVQLTKVFRPRSSDVTNVAQILTQALTRRAPSGQITSTASISFDGASQSVVVSGSPGDLQIANEIVAQLETGSPQATQMQTRFIDVGTAAEATRLLPLVEQLYRNEVASAGFGAVANGRILSDGDRLIVTASADHVTRIEALVRELRGQKSQARPRRLQIIPLQNARVDTAMTSIQTLVTDRMSDKTFADQPKPSILADATNNRILVTATDEQIKEVQQIVTVIDVTPDKGRREMRVVPLTAKPAAEVIAVVTTLLEQTAEQTANPALAPRLSADPTGKQIIVLAQAKDFERVERLIQQFDATAATAAPRQFRAVELFSRNAAEFSPLVSQLYQEQLRGTVEPLGGPATLIPESKNNRIMVSGSEAEIARVESIIRQLDPAERRAAKEETRVIRLRAAQAQELSDLVQKSVNVQNQQVRVLVDARSNSLVVNGSPEAVAAAVQIIQELDSRPESAPKEMRIIDLRSGDAATIGPMISTMLADLMKDQRGADYVSLTKIVPDPGANRLIVTGPRDELAQVSRLVTQLDQTPEQSGSARVFRLQQANASLLAPIVSNAMLRFDARGQAIRKVMIAADDKSNSLIVTGGRTDVQDATVIIERLDGETDGNEPADRRRELKILPVNTSDPDGLAGLALRVFAAQNGGRNTNLLSITPEPTGKRLIVLAPPTLLNQVETVVLALDQPADQAARELHAIDLKNVTAVDVFPTVNRIYEEQSRGKTIKPATIYPDAAGRRLNVWGTKEQAAGIQQIVATLESQGVVTRETKVYDLGRLAEAQRLMPLAQQLYRDQLANNPAAGPSDAQFISDGRSGRVIVSVRQDQTNTIEQIFARLQMGANTNQIARETRAFEVGTAADVQRLLPLVQQLYQDHWKDRSENDPPDAQIVGDALAGRIIASGKAEHLKHIEGILQQLGAGSAKPRSQARDTRVLDLSTASAVELAATVRTLYLEEAKVRFGAQTPDTLITPDTGGNRLVIVGETNELDAVENLVKKLDKVSAQSATARVFKLKSADPSKIAEILTTSLVRYDAYGRAQKRATVSVDAKTRTLIVTGDPKELAGVATIIEQLDQSLGAQTNRVMKVVTLRQGRAVEISPKLRQLYADQLSAQPELSTSEVLIMEEAASNQLILTGTEPQVALMEKILSELQAAATARGDRETRFIEVGQADELSRLQPLVLQLYQDRWKNRDSSDPADAQLIADAKNGRFIVTGRTNHLAEIEVIVSQLRASELAAPRDTRIYDLSTANAAELSTTVRSLYLDQAKSRPAAQPQETLILPDSTSNRLIVSGTTNELNLVEEIIRKLDKVSTQSGTVRLFKLKSADPAKVMEVLGNALMSYDAYGRPRRRVGLTVDAKTRTIVVAGDPKELQALQNAAVIIEQLDSALGTQAERKIKVVALKQAKASELSSKLRQLYNDQLASKPDLGTTDILIMEDTPANQLILAGSDDQLKLLDTIVGELQATALNQGARETKLFEVAQASGDLARLQPLVQQLYQDRWKAKEAGDPPDAQIIADSVNGRLVVTGRTNHLAEITTIVELLKDSATAGRRDVHVVNIRHNSAQALSSLLNQVYAKQLASTDPADRLVISALADDRTLVVEASARTFEQVNQLVTKLDGEGDGPGVIQTVHLKKARAENLAEAINSSLTNRLGPAMARRVSITAVVGVNSLLISGPTNAIDGVMKIVRELDEESAAGDIEVRVYKLENGTAKQVSALLGDLLDNVSRYQTRAQGQRFIPASISINERDNSLIISGTASHFRTVEKLLPALDKAPERAERDVQFVWLKKAKAYEVVSKLEAVFEGRDRPERPVIEADSFNNSITVIAHRGDIAQIQSLIARLDETAKDSSVQVRLRPLDRVVAEQMARMLQNIYPQMAHGQVRLVEQLAPGLPAGTPAPAQPNAPTPNPNQAPAPSPAPAPPGPGAAVSPDFIGPIRPIGLVGPIASTNAAEVLIAVDKEANALILSGPAEELDNIDRIISDLSFNFYGNEAEFRLFPLKEADPVIVARTLVDLLRQDAVPPQAGPGGPQAQAQAQALAQARSQQRRITVVAEPRTRSVIVRARPTDFSLMESLINQLDSAGATAQLEFRVVPLTNAMPEKVLPLVQQMVSQLNLIRPGEPLTVTPDPRTRGLLVVARDSVLLQVEKMIRSLDTPSPHVESEVLMISLKKANATQLAAILQGLLRPGAAGELTPDARELQEQVRRLKIQNDAGATVVLDLTQPIKISADPVSGAGGANRLILTSSPDNLKALAAVVAMMDTVPVVDGVDVKLVTLEFADANTVLQTLTTIFSQGQRLTAGPTGPNAEPTNAPGRALVAPLNLASDPRSNTLILSGRPEAIELAQRVVADLDKAIDRFLTDVRLFRLKHASATRLVPVLQAVFAEGPSVPGAEGLNTQVTRLRTLRDGEIPKMTASPKSRSALTIQADDTANILIVAARSDALALIADVIAEFDIPAASGLEMVRVYPLTHADPTPVAKVINDLYSGPRASSLRTEDKPVVSIDERTSSLIVAGSSKSFAIIEGLLQKLDQQLAFDLRDIRILPLDNADANTLAATLQRLVDARVTARAAANRGSADSLKVIIMADPRSNSLLIGGSRDSFELVEGLARQLDRSGPALSGQVRIIPLTNADARVISSTLNALFEQRYAATRSGDVGRNKPVILPDPRSNSLLVTANQEDHRTVDDLLGKLDQKLGNPALTLTVLPLKHNDSAKVATIIESIFAARQRAQVLPGQTPLPSEQIKLEPDPLNNALIISASQENLELIQGLIGRIDAEPVIPGGVFETFTLQFADAQRVANILKSLVDQGLYRPGQPASGAVRGGKDALAVSVDPRGNTLIVSASPENLSLVREVIRRVDTRDMALTGDVKVYVLKNARASSLAQTLQQFFAAKRAADTVAVNAGDRLIPVSVIADDRVNAVIVTGGKEAFDVADRVIQQLDGEGVFSRVNFKVIPLKKATATKLQATLQPIFANRAPRVRGETPDPITIVADAWVNALLIGASVEDMATVESLIARLDTDPTDVGLAVQVFPLLKADARRVATTVQGIYREGTPGSTLPITVTADERMNAIIVSAGEADTRRIGELVKKLDTDQVARVSEIRVFALRYAKAEALSSILTAALNTKPTPLSEQSPNAQSVLQFITRSQEGRDLVTSALKEAVLITPDPRVNSLIVSAPVDYMGLLEQIITRLDNASHQKAKIKVFNLTNADARQTAELLTGMFRLSQAPGAVGGGTRSIEYTLVKPVAHAAGGGTTEAEFASAVLGSEEQSALTVSIDPRTNSLLVGGTEDYVTLVSEIIESLDSSPAQERKSEVYRLRNSQAQEVALAVRTFLESEQTRVTKALGADAVGSSQRVLEREIAVVPEPVSNTLLISASPRYFAEIHSLIEELDQPQDQVLIQVLIAEVSLDNSLDLGLEWTYNNVPFAAGIEISEAKWIASGFSSAVTGGDYHFLFRALEEKGRLEVLSRPQIVTADNKPAVINVGQQIPLITDSRVTEQGDTINSFKYESVGVNLRVTPRIAPDGFVKLEVGTTNSNLSSTTVKINADADVPIINQRVASTTVSVQSGQTILIGGLIGTIDDKRVRKVPFLGDIPVVGYFFRSNRNRQERRELLILLTPQILTKSEAIARRTDLRTVTDDQLSKSRIKDEIQRDDVQKQLLDPLFPPLPVDPQATEPID